MSGTFLDRVRRLAPAASAPPKPSLAARFAAPNVKPEAWQSPRAPLHAVLGRMRPPISHSPEIDRVVAIPRRPRLELDGDLARQLADAVTAKYARHNGTCRCAPKPCLKTLKPAQAWALDEMEDVGGLLGPIGVGHGKTCLNILSPLAIQNVKVAVLLVPPALVGQLHQEYLRVSEHFHVPSLVLPDGAGFIRPGRPVLHVVPYSRFSRPESTDLLEKIGPDLIIADECFPAATRVVTDEGDLPIAEVVAGKGEHALTLNPSNGRFEWRRIVRRLKKPATKIIRVHHEYGHFDCTERQEIWTDDHGFQEAQHLVSGLHRLRQVVRGEEIRQENGDAVFGAVRAARPGATSFGDGGGSCSNDVGTGGVRRVRLDVRGAAERHLHEEEVLSDVLESDSRTTCERGAEGQVGTGASREDVAEQPDEERRVAREDGEVVERAHLPSTRRERQADGPANETRGSTRLADGVRHPHGDSEVAVRVTPACVQGGSRGPVGDVGDRGGRSHAPLEEVAILGSPERVRTRCSRVVRVEVLERGSADGSRPGGGDDSVYDLEVEGNHNFVADGIVVKNCHKLRDKSTATTSRVLRYFAAHPHTRLCAWSGTLTAKSIRDYAHLSAIALGENSPLPLDPNIVEEWSLAIDPIEWQAGMGALDALCRPGEHVHDGFRRRLHETQGVTGTRAAAVDATILLGERKAPPMPDALRKLLGALREGWVRPDGEELVDILQVAKSARELACGFFYKWTFPHGEPPELIGEWFRVRALWHKELREKLKRRVDHLDSPMLCAKAAIRAYQEPKYEGDLPVWPAEMWRPWLAIRDRVNPVPVAEWVDDYLARDAAAWAKKHRGVVWYLHDAFGRRVADLAGLPLHEGGPDAEAKILAEKGDRSIVASIRAHGTGRDGLQRIFARQLVANPPASGAEWEQLLGRLHRIGQDADEVETECYRHTSELADAIDRAIFQAKYIEGTLGSLQKLLAANVTWSR